MEKPNQIIDLITERIQSINENSSNQDEVYDKLVHDLSEHMSLDKNATRLIVDCLRISVENDYVTIDIFYGTIERILQTLINKGLVDEKDIDYIKDINNND